MAGSSRTQDRWPSEFMNVDLRDVEHLDLDPRWESSKGYARAQMQRWVESLSEVQRLVHVEHVAPQEFEAMADSSDPDRRHIGEAWKHFYKHDGAARTPDGIALEWDGAKLRVVNGRHRLQLMREAGHTFAPARVTACDEKSLAAVKRRGGECVERMAQRRQSCPAWERRVDPTRQQTRERGRG